MLVWGKGFGDSFWWWFFWIIFEYFEIYLVGIERGGMFVIVVVEDE